MMLHCTRGRLRAHFDQCCAWHDYLNCEAFSPSGNPELRLFETPTGSTIVRIDNNGAGTINVEIRVAGVTGLPVDDFLL